jgi:hypothetical protein
LIKSFLIYFGCGNFDQKKNAYYFVVTKFSDIREKIIPFFDRFQILGVKNKDYTDLSKVTLLIKAKKHLNLPLIQSILN